MENSYGQEDNSLGLWSDCDQVGDRVTVYDGKRNTDPELIRFCRGTAIPDIVSSGPDMLVVLDTSPFGSPIMAPDSANGMELEVSIKFVEQNSLHYAQNSRQCKFDIVSSENSGGKQGDKVGYVSNVLHGLAANTTCVYRFLARPTELVWLTFQKFDVIYHKKDIYRSASCLNRLALYDPKTKVRIGEYCENSPPKLCDHSYLQSQNFYSSLSSKNESLEFRACVGGNESYISVGNELTLVETVGESTSVTSLEFIIRYEFIETVQDGSANTALTDQPEQTTTTAVQSGFRNGFTCHRVFHSDSYSSRLSQHESASFSFSTPRNVLFYGRGGRQNLSCSYTFHGKPGERVNLVINSLKLPQTGGCTSQPLLGRDHYTCQRGSSGRRTRGYVWVSEMPDQRTPLYQHCFCQNVKYQKHAPIVFLSNTSSLRVDFRVDDMRPSEDYRVRWKARPTCIFGLPTLFLYQY